MTNGWHRLAICKFLKLESIFVRIGMRHKQWVEFCDHLLNFSKSEWKTDGRGQIYQPIEHIEFLHLKPIWTVSRYFTISKNITCKGSLLDIGSLFGYLCHKFEDDSFDCTAIELQDSYFYFLEKIRIAKNKKFKSIHGSVFDLKETKFDVVLALNIFHHFLKEQNVFRKFKEFLSRLEVKELFLQTHDHEDPQMKSAFANFCPDCFARFVADHVKLKNCELIGCENDRKIFKIS